MKGINQLATIVTLVSLGSIASATNLITNGSFEVNNHPSLDGWTPTVSIPLPYAAASTFVGVTDAAWVPLVGGIAQGVNLTAGDHYTISGIAACFDGATDDLSVSRGILDVVLNQNAVNSAFSFNFTADHTGTYVVDFGSLKLGRAEISDLSLTQAQGQPTPEPCSMVALGAGLVGVIRARRKAKLA